MTEQELQAIEVAYKATYGDEVWEGSDQQRLIAEVRRLRVLARHAFNEGGQMADVEGIRGDNPEIMDQLWQQSDTIEQLARETA